MPKAGALLLEPIMQAEVMTPEEYAGDVIGGLNSRGAAITGMDSRPDAWIVHATVPFKEMLGYNNRLRGITRGRGQCTLRFDHYAPLPGSGLDPAHPGAAIGLRTA
jgi:elongation factor G